MNDFTISVLIIAACSIFSGGGFGFWLSTITPRLGRASIFLISAAVVLIAVVALTWLAVYGRALGGSI